MNVKFVGGLYSTNINFTARDIFASSILTETHVVMDITRWR